MWFLPVSRAPLKSIDRSSRVAYWRWALKEAPTSVIKRRSYCITAHPYYQDGVLNSTLTTNQSFPRPYHVIYDHIQNQLLRSFFSLLTATKRSCAQGLFRIFTEDLWLVMRIAMTQANCGQPPASSLELWGFLSSHRYFPTRMPSTASSYSFWGVLLRLAGDCVSGFMRGSGFVSSSRIRMSGAHLIFRRILHHHTVRRRGFFLRVDHPLSGMRFMKTWFTHGSR